MTQTPSIPLSELTPSIAADRIERFADEGRLIQEGWHRYGNDGRELACLLGAIQPGIQNALDCPAQVMPQWAAQALVFLFDGSPMSDAVRLGKEFAAALRRTEGWTSKEWDSVRTAFLICCVQRAVDSADPVSQQVECWPEIKAACLAVIAASGCREEIDRAIRKAAIGSATDAAAYAAYAAYYAYYATSDAAYTAYTAASYAVKSAAKAGGSRRAQCALLFDDLNKAILAI